MFATNQAFMNQQLVQEMEQNNSQTYQRVKNINDNVVKQRKYLPQTEGVYTNPSKRSGKKSKT